ncbi:hypothetical protein, partial [Flavobacterium chungangense]
PKSDYALHQIRNFLIEQPNEIIILKFQNFLNLTIDDDYVDLVNLLVTYLEFNDPAPRSVPNETLCKRLRLCTIF